MFCWPLNAASTVLIILLFVQSHIPSYCQARFNSYFYPRASMTPLPASPMGYAAHQPVYHLPQDKTEVILVGNTGGKQHHHHHHHHHHKNIHHHHHGHQHSHGHNHNHDHKHDHDHKHGHNHNHNHDHNHDHKHAHGHKHQHNHGHGHLHNHGHNHDHKHAHVLLHIHGHRQKHSPDNGNSYQQNHNKNQINDNGYEQDYGNKHINGHQEHHYNTQHSNQLSPVDYNKGQQGHNLKIHYDESGKGDVYKSHYEHSGSNENASYEPKQEDTTQNENSHSSEIRDESGTREESISKDISSSEPNHTSQRFSKNNFKKISRRQQHNRARSHRKNYSPRFRHSNIPNDYTVSQLKVLKQSSEEVSLKPQVHYGVRLGENGYGEYHKKEASVSAVTFLHENGDIITVGNNDPLISIEKPLKLEDSDPQESYRGESLESKLSAGRMALTPSRDYKASIGKVDEVLNIPLFD